MSSIARKIASGTALSMIMAGTASAQTDPAYRAPLDDAAGTINAISFLPLALLTAIVMGGAGAASAAGDEGQGFSAATVAEALARVAVSYGRVVADIRYGALETDSTRGSLVMRDLQIDGIGDYENCSITLGKLEVSGLSFWGAEDLRSRFEASDLAIATNCFGPNAAMIGMVTGGPTIPLESLVIDARQISGSGAATFDIEAVSPSIARIEGSADFAYVALSMPGLLEEISGQSNPYDVNDPTFDKDGNLIQPGMGPSQPEAGLRGQLRAAHLTAENLGLWERLKPLMPPDMIGPEAVQGVVTAEPGTELRTTEEALAGVLTNFIAQPGLVTAEIRPGEPITFDTTRWLTPEEAVVQLQPIFSNALPTPPLPLIAAPDSLDDPLALGLALAEGRGLPQNSRRAIEVLSPLEDNAEAMLTVARLSTDTDPASAYAHAQKAAVLGDSSAPAALDRIEGRIATADLLAAQAPADSDVPADTFDTVAKLRDLAYAYAEGKGVPRSYLLARRLAGSAAAAGDGQAASLIARLDSRFGDDADWIAARDAAADQALEDWTAQDLAARFAAR